MTVWAQAGPPGPPPGGPGRRYSTGNWGPGLDHSDRGCNWICRHRSGARAQHGDWSALLGNLLARDDAKSRGREPYPTHLHRNDGARQQRPYASRLDPAGDRAMGYVGEDSAASGADQRSGGERRITCSKPTGRSQEKCPRYRPARATSWAKGREGHRLSGGSRRTIRRPFRSGRRW